MEEDSGPFSHQMVDEEEISTTAHITTAQFTTAQEIGQVQGTTLSETARELICSSWRDSSKSTYIVYIKKYKKFSLENKFDYLQPSEYDVANFLSSCFDKGYGYSAIKVARAAVSSIITFDYSESKVLKRLMRGVYQKRPQLQKTMTWDTVQVLEFWKNVSPAKKITMMELTIKTALLLVLAMCQRQQALHLMDVRNIDIKYDRLKVRFGDPLKMTCPNFHQKEITILSYPPDKRLCPVNYYKRYLKRTNKYRNHNNVFLITQRPYTVASKTTISGWVRKALSMAGIDMKMFTPHSTRAASSSKMSKTSVSLSTIVNTAGWKRSNTFAKFYKKKITSTEVSVENLL